MKRNRLAQMALPLVLVLVLVLVLATPASASTIGEGRLTLQLDRGLRTLLHSEGAKLRGVTPAVGRNNVINLPLRKGGGLESTGKGRLLADGGLQFAAKGRRATFRDLVLDTAFGTLSGKLNGRLLALATVSGLSSERRGFGAVVGLRRMTLTQAAIAAIDARLGIPGLLRAGQALGSASAIARFDQLSLIGGKAYLGFSKELGEKLESLKVETEPLGDGWLFTQKPPAPVLTVAYGEVGLDLASGRFRSKDGFLLKQHATGRSLTLQRIEFDLYSGEISVSQKTLATFSLPVVHKNAYTGEISTPNSPVVVSAELATLLNQSFADPSSRPGLFVAGEPLGTIALGLSVHGPPRE